jgi:hypothetical protein
VQAVHVQKVLWVWDDIKIRVRPTGVVPVPAERLFAVGFTVVTLEIWRQLHHLLIVDRI